MKNIIVDIKRVNELKDKILASDGKNIGNGIQESCRHDKTSRFKERHIVEICETILNSTEDNATSFLPLGIEYIDKDILLKKGDLVLISGRPGMGNTSILLSLVNNGIENKKIDFYVIKDNPKETVLRLAAIRSNIPLNKMHDEEGKLSPKIKNQLMELGKADIRFYYKNVVTANDLIECVRSQAEDRDVVVIDDIHCVLPDIFDGAATVHEIDYFYNKHFWNREVGDYFYPSDEVLIDSENDWLADLVEGIKEEAVNSGFLGIVSIEHSRITEYRHGHRPEIVDLKKYGGRLVDIPDIILFPFRNSLYYEDDWSSGSVEITVHNNKDYYSCSSYPASWKKETAEFSQYDWNEDIYDDLDW